MELKKKIEALLFSSARWMAIGEISAILKVEPDEITKNLVELMNDYNEKDSSLTLENDGERWKLTTKEDYTHVVKNIVTKTELTKTLMETLSIIAFKYPIKQSDLIKIRTNKAYDHLRELEEMGYITRQKFGRTRLIKLSQKFFDYFSLPQEKLKDQFKDFEEIAKTIEEKEGEIKKIKDEQRKKAKEPEKEVDLIDDDGHKVKLDVVDEQEIKEKKIEEEAQKGITEAKETIGQLEVFEEPQEEKTEDSEEEIEITPELEEGVGDKLGELLGGDTEKTEENKEETNTNKEAEAPVEEGTNEPEESEEPVSEGETKGESVTTKEKAEEELEKTESSSEEVQKKEAVEPQEEGVDLLEAAAQEEEKKKDDTSTTMP